MIFLGLLFPKNDESLIASKSKNGFLQNQVNTFQWNCIDGMYENIERGITIVNALPVGTFPRNYKDFYIPSKTWGYHDERHYQIGSPNIPVLKQFMRELNCKKTIRNLDDKNILIYSTYLPFLKAVKNLDSSYKITLMVADLPEYYDLSNVGFFRKLLRKINNNQIYKCLKRIDNFVLFTDAMKTPLLVGNRPYTVVEGICSRVKNDGVSKSTPAVKRILYTGSLHKKFGIDVLIDAFKGIVGDNYELCICGGGDYEEAIKEASVKDSRIKFFGYVSKEKVLQLQKESAVLVNPRQDTDDYTKYSFPSKTMEYLLSGVPMVGYKLAGIPDEYDAYINYVKDNTPQSLTETLISVCADVDGSFKKKAKDAIDFLTLSKSPAKQGEKILKLMSVLR